MFYLLLIQCVLSFAALLLTALFFRSKPPLPPSFSAIESAKKPHVTAFLPSIWALLKRKNFVILFLVFGISLGAAMSFSVLLDQIVAPAGYGDVIVVWFHFNLPTTA